MTRFEQLAFCKVCVHQKKDFEKGILCGLTDQVADFSVTCESFDRNTAEYLNVDSFNTIESQLATQGQRFTNFIIDRIFLFGLGALFGAAIGLILYQFAPEYFYVLEEDNLFLDYLLGFIIGVVYYSFFEGFTGRSLGKFFTKTKVVTEDGERPDFKTIFIRSLCRFIPFEAFSFLGGANEPGWHDKFSKTRVITID